MLQNNTEWIFLIIHIYTYRFHVPGERLSPVCLSFNIALEGFCGRPGADPNHRWFHNKIHVLIDGSMCCTATASNDPLFILHHTFIDKIFEVS